MRLLTRPGVDPAVVIGQEWGSMGFARRLMVRLLAPETARAARFIAATTIQYVPVAPSSQGAFTKFADRHLG